MESVIDAVPSALDALVGEVVQGAPVTYEGMTMMLHARTRLDHFSMVEALAAHMGSTRTKAVNMLLGVGIEAVLAQLPAELAARLTKERADLMADALHAKKATWTTSTQED